jgi:serine protease AprX
MTDERNHAVPSIRRRKPLQAALLAAVSVAMLAAAAGASWGSSGRGGAITPVVVRAKPGAAASVETQTRLLGGTIGRKLPIIGGFSALVPQAAVAKLRLAPGVVTVTRDAHLEPHSTAYDPGADVNSMVSTTQSIGAKAWWAAGYAGQGVDVALIDTGVSPVEGLNAPDKLVYGPDLSLESQAPNLTELDTYGHGTFMAGLIAGRDAAATAPYDGAPASAYRGVAPNARIVSIKVGTADGGTDVSQVIAAIDWVVQHAHDSGLNIRVLNLAYGTNSTQAYELDPLAFAAEQAWKHGIVVVAAAGNNGYQRGDGALGLADPAYDPYVIGVGASDSVGTQSASDDRVAAFSASASCGQCKAPDFVAPGSHIQGLRVINSWLDVNRPEGRLDDRYFRGSGTSQATAIASGAAALVLSRYPTLTPDQVKRFFQDAAGKLAGSGKYAQGAGELRLGAMLDAAPPWSAEPQSFAGSTGTGLLELSRGSEHVARDGVVLSGEQDIFGKAVATPALALLEASGSSWSGGTWNGSTWAGSTWSGSTWSGSTWSGSTWSGSTWSGSSWSGSSWSGSSWSGSSWSGSSWSGSSWSGSSWSDATWG